MPVDVDNLNDLMIELGDYLTPLILMAYPPAAGASGVHVVVGDLVKVASAGRIAVVTKISLQMVNFKYVKPGTRHVTAEGRTVQVWKAGWGTEYRQHIAKRRLFYLGPVRISTAMLESRSGIG